MEEIKVLYLDGMKESDTAHIAETANLQLRARICQYLDF